MVYAIIGALSVKDVVRAVEREAAEWSRNAHTRRDLSDNADDVVVIGNRAGSGRLARAIPIGEFRAGAYRVTQSLLAKWGGISAKDGFLQRSAVFPSALESTMFLSWWDAQEPELVAENNPSGSNLDTQADHDSVSNG